MAENNTFRDYSPNPNRRATAAEVGIVNSVLAEHSRAIITPRDALQAYGWNIDDPTTGGRFGFTYSRRRNLDDLGDFYFTQAEVTFIGPESAVEGTDYTTRSKITWTSVLGPEAVNFTNPDSVEETTTVFQLGIKVPDPSWDESLLDEGFTGSIEDELPNLGHVQLAIRGLALADTQLKT